MKFVIESLNIEKLKIGPHMSVDDKTFAINIKEIEKVILEDPRIESVDINLVRPGDPIRIVNITDVIQPRCKIDMVNADFPGFLGELQIAGHGQTRSIKGVNVVVSNPVIKGYGALLDMSGIAAELSKYGKMNHVSIAPNIAEGVDYYDFEDAIKIAGLKTSVLLAQATLGYEADIVEEYELDIPISSERSDLPRIAYYFQINGPQYYREGIPDRCFYGSTSRYLDPTLVHPNEILDGGIIGTHAKRMSDTYSVQNHALVKELYRRHGKELLFCGVVCGSSNVSQTARTRSAIRSAHLVKHFLKADGVVLTKIFSGAAHMEMAQIAEECEKLGVKASVNVHAVSDKGRLSEELLFDSDLVNLIISNAYIISRIKLPLEAERIIGGTSETEIECPEKIKNLAGDLMVDVQEFMIAGMHDLYGGANIQCKEY